MDNQRKPYRFDLYLGISLVSIGALLLLDRIFRIHLGRFLWPFFIILPGLAFFLLMKRLGKEAGFLAIPGSIVTATGLLLLYQSATGHWESWAYAWALIAPTAIGVGLIIFGNHSDLPSMNRIGTGMLKIGAILFIIGGIVFELLFRISDSRLNQILLPFLLIAIGAYMALFQTGLIKLGRSNEPVILEVPPTDDSSNLPSQVNQETGEETPEEV